MMGAAGEEPDRRFAPQAGIVLSELPGEAERPFFEHPTNALFARAQNLIHSVALGNVAHDLRARETWVLSHLGSDQVAEIDATDVRVADRASPYTD